MDLFPPEFIQFIQPAFPFLAQGWKLFEVWWWVFPPFLLWKTFIGFYLVWRNSIFDSKIPKVILEIKLPETISKPIKAMEYVFAGFHSIHDPANFREKWIDGQFLLGFGLEIAAIDGKVHFFVRVPKMYQELFESILYSQYPNIEISVAEDYTRKVPQEIPNKNWDLWGMSMRNTQKNGYPLRTYVNFEREMETEEERMVDPLALLLENLATLRQGEQLWIQLLSTPIRESDVPWIDEAKVERDKLVRRPAKAPPPPPLINEAFSILLKGETAKVAEQPKEVIPPEMKLTPGEREIVEAIENKISKHAFRCSLRFIYVGRREVFFKPRVRIPIAFFKAVGSEHMNGFRPQSETVTRSKTMLTFFLDDLRTYVRKRKILRHYRFRLPPFFPRHTSDGTFILNTEELATMFHFPSGIVAPAPSVERITVKKSEAPRSLPFDDEI